MKRFADVLLRESVASAMRQNRLPEELSVVDVHKAVLRLPKCDFLRNAFLGQTKEEDGSEPGGAGRSEGLAGSETQEAPGEVRVKQEPMDTDQSPWNLEPQASGSTQGFSEVHGSSGFSLNLKTEEDDEGTLDESSNDSRSLLTPRSGAGRAQAAAEDWSISRTSSLASMTEFETMMPQFEIPPFVQDDQ